MGTGKVVWDTSGTTYTVTTQPPSVYVPTTPKPTPKKFYPIATAYFKNKYKKWTILSSLKDESCYCLVRPASGYSFCMIKPTYKAVQQDGGYVYICEQHKEQLKLKLPAPCTCHNCSTPNGWKTFQYYDNVSGQTNLSSPPVLSPYTLRQNRGAVKYGLDGNLLLYKAAADFYLLFDTWLETHDDRIKWCLDMHSYHVGEQLCRYLELACLGEFRHATEYWNTNNLKLCNFHEDVKLVIDYLSKLRREITGNTDYRMLAWSEWDKLYKEMCNDDPTRLHKAIAKGFRAVWEGKTGGIGGVRWAVCMETALAYRSGKLSLHSFVDQAFSLKHNGGIAYNKFWNTDGINMILDFARDGRVNDLAHYAREEVIKVCYESKK